MPIPVYAIYFDTGLARLKPESTPALEEIAKLLQSRATLKLLVVGHTDSTGSLELNMKLSAAQLVRKIADLATTFPRPEHFPSRIRYLPRYPDCHCPSRVEHLLLLHPPAYLEPRQRYRAVRVFIRRNPRDCHQFHG